VERMSRMCSGMFNMFTFIDPEITLQNEV
jgi:hypothetical protein